MSSLLLTKFLFDEGEPSNYPGWQKEDFVVFIFEIINISFATF